MSDYGDDYSDYGDEWFYVEEEYMAADDLAEHAVASPPPMNTMDEELLPEWDRFDYFNDLEYASDGYDDVNFEAQDVKGIKAGQKRKRPAVKEHSKKRRAMGESPGHTNAANPQCSPIVWRSQAERELQPRFLDDNEMPYALLKNWREQLAETPKWARASPSPSLSPDAALPRPSKGKAPRVSNTASPAPDIDLGDESEGLDNGAEDGEEQGISEDAIMAALQRQLAAAGGPLSGMDPQQLLEFAMRMAAGKDDGDDIAGEMADAMLDGEEDEEDEDAEGNLLSWIAQQRNADKDANASDGIPKPSDSSKENKRPPTPPLSETNKSVQASETTAKSVPRDSRTSKLKRKAGDDIEDADGPTKVVKKRVTRSFDAPTTASQAKAAPARVTRSSRGKKS